MVCEKRLPLFLPRWCSGFAAWPEADRQAEIEIELGTDGDDEWAQAAQRGLVKILKEGIEIVAHAGGIGIERGRIHKPYDLARHLVAQVLIGVGRNEGADALNGEIEGSVDGAIAAFGATVPPLAAAAAPSAASWVVNFVAEETSWPVTSPPYTASTATFTAGLQVTGRSKLVALGADDVQMTVR